MDKKSQKEHHTKRNARKSNKGAASSKKAGEQTLDPDISKTAFYERAEALNIAVRSPMSKGDIMPAIQRAN